MLYFTSQRDGFRCVWVQRFDPAAGRLSGEGFAAIHFHDSRRSLGNVALAELEIEITRDRIFLVLGEVTSNIWILEPAPAQTAGR